MDYNKNRTYYNVLGLSETASMENIERMYNRMKFEEGRIWDRELDEAYSVLHDTSKRREYDQKLAEARNQTVETVDSVVEEPAPVVEEPAPVVEEPTPVVEEPTPVVEEPAPVVEEPVPVVEEPAPVVEEPAPVVEEPVIEDPVFVELPTPTQSTPAAPVAPAPVAPVAPTPVAPSPVAPAIDPELQKKLNKHDIPKVTIKYEPNRIPGTIAGFFVAGPIGAVAVNVWLSKNKTKLVRDSRPKRISKLETKETALFEEYSSKLEREIIQLLGEPHNDYKLKIQELKYQNQIELLTKILEVKLNTPKNHNSLGRIFFTLADKMEIVAIKMKINDLTKNLADIKTKISQYHGSNPLKKINEELLKNNAQIRALVEQQHQLEKNNQSTSAVSLKIRNLVVYQTRLINKRDKLASREVAKVSRTGNIYNSLLNLGIKNRMLSLRYITSSQEEIGEFLEEESSVKTR